MGIWHVYSKKDKRWEKSGRSEDSQAMKDWVSLCKNLYGDPPDDLCCTFHKE